MTEAVENIAEAPSPAPSTLLQQRIVDLRRRHTSVALLTGLAMALVVSLELLALGMFLDW